MRICKNERQRHDFMSTIYAANHENIFEKMNYKVIGIIVNI